MRASLRDVSLTDPLATHRPERVLIRRAGVVIVAGFLGCTVLAPPAHAEIIRGFAKILGGVLAVPMSVLSGTFSGPPVIGTLVGAVNGVVGGVGSVFSGVLDVASSAIPLAKAAAPYILPFAF